MNKLAETILTESRKICESVDLEALQGARIIVTGASGLLGHYFLACLKLLSMSKNQAPASVTAIFHSPPSDYLLEMLDYPMAHMMIGDITDIDFSRSLPRADYIIHAAGYGQPGRFMDDPVKTLQINTAATLELFNHLDGGNFLFISTSEVYSGAATIPYRESIIGTTNTTHPRACYIEGKRCGEAICNAYRARGIQAKSARLALAYGPGTKKGDQRVINSFIEKALLRQEIRLLDQGQAKRTYCYAIDAVEILWNILLFGQEPIYNVGGTSRTTISALAKKIGHYLNVPVIFPEETNLTAIGAPEEVFLDMTLTEAEFGKNKYIDFEYGLAQTIEWQKHLYAK